MSDQDQGGDFAICRQHIAHFYAQHLEDRIGWRNHLHLRKLCVNVGKLCARLRYAHLGRRDIFLLRFRCTVGALCISSRNNPALEQILLAPRVIAQKHPLRFLRVGIVNSRVDLRSGEIAARSQLRRIQLHDQLAFVQTIPFRSQDFFDASTCARSDVRFVHFNCAGDGILSRVAAT
jgi:hypothetical protein